ncbi:conjugal transfer protein TraC [Escherichia coli]|nr:conjugal transfer protein TraC [Escherichia coli]EFI4242917.1 conjugal transfer protein TraC [Escherichia coli]RCQ58362.1 conjugal transfer protein TraC [Escherichia coli]TXQ63772.1 conjugal transfer protein TraC [Escherichia coli]HAH1515386.1 conjugal transfer protein TraC [Escherichia coli]
MGHGQQSAFTLKYRDSHNGSHSPQTFFRKSRFADVDVPFLIIRPLRLS